jgi:predicted nucleotidyltransferase
MHQTDSMAASSRPSSYHDVVDEPLLRTITAEIQAAIPGAEVRLFGSRARGTARPDSDLDLLVTVPDALGWKLAHHRLPIELLLFSASEVEERRQGQINVIAEAFRYGRRLEKPGCWCCHQSNHRSVTISGCYFRCCGIRKPPSIATSVSAASPCSLCCAVSTRNPSP